MRQFILLSIVAVSTAIHANTTVLVLVIVSNATMSQGENSFYAPTMFVNDDNELPVQANPIVLPNNQYETIFTISNWNYQVAQHTIVNYQLVNDMFSSNCTEPASTFCTDSHCTTLKINMQFHDEAVCEK